MAELGSPDVLTNGFCRALGRFGYLCGKASHKYIGLGFFLCLHYSQVLGKEYNAKLVNKLQCRRSYRSEQCT